MIDPDKSSEPEASIEPSRRRRRIYFEDSAWEEGGNRGRVAKILFDVGLEAKAHRFWKCHREGIPLDCSRDPGHKFFAPYLCGCRFCSNCAPNLQRQLSARYIRPVISVIQGFAGHPAYALARINFSVRSTGDDLAPERVRWFNRCVRKLFQRLFPDGGYGVLWVNEVGHEKRGRRAHRKARGLNLHAHGIYLGPRLAWHRVKALWVEITGGEGLGVWLTFLRKWCHDPEGATRRTWGHLVKYVSKVPAETPERIAALEIALDGVRRVHSMGLFYNADPADDEECGSHVASCCPVCGGDFYLNLRPWEVFSLEVLKREGRRELAEVRRELSRKLIFGAHGPP